MVVNVNDESATITSFALTQRKPKFNKCIKQWLRDVPQTSSVDNHTKALLLEESGIGEEAKIVLDDDNQATLRTLTMIFIKTFRITCQL